MSRAGLHWIASLSILLVACGISLWPVAATGRLPELHDAAFHALVAEGVASGLADGILYPRWVSTAHRGFGAHMLVSYPPLGAFVSGIPDFLGASPLGGLAVAAALAIALAGVAFLWAARSLGATPLAAAAGSALYVVLPYHAIDLHHRFALAELFAFLWPPLAAALLVRLFDPQRRARGRGGWIGAALSLALVVGGAIVTQPAIAWAGALLLGIAAVPMAFTTRTWKRLAIPVAAGVLGGLLAGVYVAPLLFDSQAADYVYGLQWFDWHRNFPFQDETALGYPVAPLKPLVRQAFWIQVALAGLALTALRRRLRGGPALVAGLFGVATVVQLGLSSPIWRYLPGLAYLEFPWRFQLFQVLFASLLVSWALSWGGPRSRVALAACALAVAVYSALLPDLSSYTFDATTFQGRDIHQLVWKEHLPEAMRQDKGFEWRRLTKGRVRVAGPGRVRIEEWSSHRRRLRITARGPVVVTLKTFVFPAWHAEVDGEPTAIATGRDGAIELRLARGEHEVDVRFTATAAQRGGALASAAALATLLLAGVLARRTGSGDAARQDGETHTDG